MHQQLQQFAFSFVFSLVFWLLLVGSLDRQEVIAGLVVAGAVAMLTLGRPSVLAGIVLSNHLFRMVLALAIAEAGANLLLILAGYRWDAVAPILENARAMVDPVPQAMVLTAIVIGVGVQALALSLVIRVKQRYGTLDMQEARRRMLADLDHTAGVAPSGRQEQPAGERPLPKPVVIAETAGPHD